MDKNTYRKGLELIKKANPKQKQLAGEFFGRLWQENKELASRTAVRHSAPPSFHATPEQEKKLEDKIRSLEQDIRLIKESHSRAAQAQREEIRILTIRLDEAKEEQTTSKIQVPIQTFASCMNMICEFIGKAVIPDNVVCDVVKKATQLLERLAQGTSLNAKIAFDDVMISVLKHYPEEAEQLIRIAEKFKANKLL